MHQKTHTPPTPTHARTISQWFGFTLAMCVFILMFPKCKYHKEMEKTYIGTTMYPLGLGIFQHFCFRLSDRRLNPTHWTEGHFLWFTLILFASWFLLPTLPPTHPLVPPMPVSPLLWRHNDHDSVSNHQPHDRLLNRLFRRRSKKTSKLRVTGLCAVNSPGTGEFPAQMASYAENVSIWWRHHALNTSRVPVNLDKHGGTFRPCKLLI